MASMDGGPRKRPKSAKVDHISSLPDEILSLILSLLPTKSAVATSILSNRWKYVWTFITSLHFEAPNHNKFMDSTSKRHLKKFVNHVFHCCNSPRIDKFVLHLYPNYLGKRSRVFAWVDEAIKRNVSELDISVSKLPLSVFTCRTLKVLTLCAYDFTDTKTVSFDLPCLKLLFIKGNGLLRHHFMQKLISSCPVLEHLILGGCLLSLNTFMVSSPTLKTLDLQPSQPSWFSSSTEISVEAPNLEYLHMNERFVNYNIKGDLSLLRRASVNIGSTFQGMPSRFKLPNFFSNLTCLELITRDKRFWAMLPKLIRSSPKLEVLSLEQYGGDDQVKSYYTWVEPKSAAKCLGHHLEVIQIKGFKGTKHELQLLKYFLGSAKVLRTLTINCQGLKREEEISFFGEVLKFSRASKYCEVQFHGDLISN